MMPITANRCTGLYTAASLIPESRAVFVIYSPSTQSMMTKLADACPNDEAAWACTRVTALVLLNAWAVNHLLHTSLHVSFVVVC